MERGGGGGAEEVRREEGKVWGGRGGVRTLAPNFHHDQIYFVAFCSHDPALQPPTLHPHSLQYTHFHLTKNETPLTAPVTVCLITSASYLLQKPSTSIFLTNKPPRALPNDLMPSDSALLMIKGHMRSFHIFYPASIIIIVIS